MGSAELDQPVMPYVAIVTGAHLCRNPRVVKEAEALSEAGYRVTVLRPVLDPALAAQDVDIASDTAWAVQTTADLSASRGASVWARLVRRAAMEAVRRGTEHPEALGYGVRRSLQLARALGADLTIGHQEVGLWVVNRLADEGRRVGVDLEDWYSEDLLPEARQSRPLRLLRREEAAAVQRGGHVTTTSQALADRLAETYGGPAPTVIYNAFPQVDRAALDRERRDRVGDGDGRLSLHWVSQTIGAGRGLEDVLDALSLVEAPIDLHLRGQCSPEVEASLRTHLSTDRGHTLTIHGLVPPSELLSRIAEHDIGLALEAQDSPSRDLTVTNKILHYLLAGLPVVATSTAGQEEVAARAPGAVVTFPIGDVPALARAINGLALPAALRRASAAALDAARREFHWEHQRQSLLDSVEAALTVPSRR